MSKKLGSINEVVVFGHLGDPPPQTPGPLPGPPSVKAGSYRPQLMYGQNDGFRVEHCASMRGWQREIYDALQQKNVYVIAKPGAGKTTPVICYWAEKVLGFNPTLSTSTNFIQLLANFERLIYNPTTVGKTLLLIPTRNLATTTFADFVQRFGQMILQGLELIIDNYGFNHPPVKNLLFEMFNKSGMSNIPSLLARRDQTFQNYSVSQESGYKQQLQEIDQELYKAIALQIKDFIESKLISSITGVGVKGNPKNDGPIIITIYVLGASIFEQLPKDSIKLLVVDEAHLMQSLPDDTEGDTEDKCRSLYKILRNLGNTKLVFLSGTVNPTAAHNFGDYLELAFLGKHNLRVIEADTPGNPSEVKIIPDDNLRNDNYLVNLITNPTSRANLIILFSKDRIRNLARAALAKSGRVTSQQVNDGAYSPFKHTSWAERHQSTLNPYKPKSQSFDINNKSANTMNKYINKVPGAEEISDPLLREAVTAGFGFIFRKEDGGDEYEKDRIAKDMVIVTNLFHSQKIRTLIATDAVGIGVNLTVQNLYIPTIEKFSGGKNVKLDTGNASQLFNRVGRMAFPVSAIYTPQEYYDDVVSIISSQPADFAKRITFEHIPEQLLKSYDVFKSLWATNIGRYAISSIGWSLLGRLFF